VPLSYLKLLNRFGRFRRGSFKWAALVLQDLYRSSVGVESIALTTRVWT